MKDFILDSTYKDTIIINSNDDIFTIPSNNLSHTTITHHTINLVNPNSNSISNHSKNNKFNAYNLIDYL